MLGLSNDEFAQAKQTGLRSTITRILAFAPNAVKQNGKKKVPVA
jgi:hypothetical protein